MVDMIRFFGYNSKKGALARVLFLINVTVLLSYRMDFILRKSKVIQPYGE